MPVTKAHQEFHRLDLASGWEPVPGYPPGIVQKTLSGALDEAGRRGSRTRLMMFGPGAFTTEPVAHDFWEEVFLVAGDFVVGNDPEGRGGEEFAPFTYACRPPGVRHGPFRSAGGCLLFEVHYFDPA